MTPSTMHSALGKAPDRFAGVFVTRNGRGIRAGQSLFCPAHLLSVPSFRDLLALSLPVRLAASTVSLFACYRTCFKVCLLLVQLAGFLQATLPVRLHRLQISFDGSLDLGAQLRTASRRKHQRDHGTDR